MGIGRAGGIVSSALGNLMPSMSIAFVLYAVGFGVGALIGLKPAVETSHRSLVDTGKVR